MGNRLVWNFVGKVLIGLSILFFFPIIVGILYKENVVPFIVPQLISFSLGIVLQGFKLKNEHIYARDGLKIVSLSWILISIIGAFPLIINKDAGVIDAIFETVSGFTTTGATIFDDVESLNKSILFWRSFSHFIGGMGVLAFVMTIIPLSHRDKSMHVLKAEMPGPTVGKLVPSLKKTLAYLYIIYIGLTVIELILLLFGGLNFFDSLLISFGTAGTGGFSVLNSSIETYSVFNKCVIALFMVMFGVNFNIYFLMLMGNIKHALKSEELKIYIGVIFFSIIFIFANTYHTFASTKAALLGATFHVSSIITSTGYSIGDINVYPTSCRIVMMLLMIMSACAGSTCGGFKISRLVIIVKSIKRDLRKVIHPNSVQTITFEGKKISEDTIKSTTTFMFLYVVIIIMMFFLVSFDNYSFETTLNAVFTTFGNVGLCFDISSFSEFSDFSKIVLCIGMLLGRLEIFPLITLFTNLKKD